MWMPVASRKRTAVFTPAVADRVYNEDMRSAQACACVLFLWAASGAGIGEAPREQPADEPKDLPPLTEKAVQEAIEKGQSYLLSAYGEEGLKDAERERELRKRLQELARARKDQTAEYRRIQEELQSLEPSMRDAFKDRAIHLAAYALIASGRAADEEAVERLLDAVAKRLREGEEQTYDLGLSILALTASGRRGEEEEGRYGADRKRRRRYESVVKTAVERLEEGQLPNGCWSYGPAVAHARAGDLSNAQFAVLGLGAAEAAGVHVSAETWRKVWEGFRAWHAGAAADGRAREGNNRKRKKTLSRRDYEAGEETDVAPDGWGYSPQSAIGGMATPSMTCAGVCSLILARAALSEKSVSEIDVREIPEALSGLLWIEQKDMPETFGDRPKNAPGAVKVSRWLNHYHYYSLERAGALSRRRTFGPYDWYAEGARRLLAEQEENGSWEGSYGPIVSTAFALLFLSRSTEATFRTGHTYEVGGWGDPPPADGAVPKGEPDAVGAPPKTDPPER